jgi:hypothetical protein
VLPYDMALSQFFLYYYGARDSIWQLHGSSSGDAAGLVAPGKVVHITRVVAQYIAISRMCAESMDCIKRFGNECNLAWHT